MSERQTNTPTMRALLPSRLVPEDMLSEWQGPNLPNTTNYAPPPDSLRGRMGDVLMQGIAALGGFTGLPMSGEGDRAALLGELLAAGMPLVGGVKQLAKLVGAENKVAQGIKAYHGSPHDFDEFSLGKIGTGEGAQAYGHGLYFADNEKVAKRYADDLAKAHGNSLVARKGGQVYKQGDDMVGETIEAYKYLNAGAESAGQFPHNRHYYAKKHIEENIPAGPWRDRVLAAAEDMKGATFAYEPARPRMYEVNIHADPEDFLDWDAPLSQQSDKAQRSLAGLVKDDSPLTGEYRKHIGYMLNNEGNFSSANSVTGEDFVNLVGPDKAGTEALKQSGIPGIKYFDGASRSAGQGSRNYVVFDDKLISIVKKYGIAAALSAGAISELEARQLQAQGYQ